MAFAEVGSGSQRATKYSGASTDLSTLAFPGNVLSGSLLIVGGTNWQSGGSATITVTDTLGTSYTVLLVISGEFTGFIAYGVSPSAGANTVTVDPAGTANFTSYAIDEFSGQHATPLDVDGGNSTGTSTTPSDGLTTLAANDLIIGVAGWTNLSNTAITPADTQIGENEDNLNQQAFNAQFRIVTTAQAYTEDWTLGTSRTWYCLTAAFKPAVAAGGLKGNLSLLGVGQ